MRILLLLRGSAGCGKSTWIEQNGLKPYTLSADDIRLLCQSPVLTENGTEAISQANDKTVWNTLFKLLEVRMQRGEFTVIDATNSKTSEMNRYKEMCDTYRYRIYCVDFTDIPIEEVKYRNSQREELKRVPDEVIDKMYSRFATQKVPSGIKVIKPYELDKIWVRLFDFSEYKKIHHIGDIHGCNTVLQDYLNSNGGIKDDEFYIFLGDYIDRGIENAEVIKFLISIIDKKNVLLLEGNHEKWLQIYSHGGIAKSKEFELFTRPQLEDSGIDKKDIRQLYRRLAQCAYYKYDDNVYFVCHGGISKIPDNITFVATDQMIHGVGTYKSSEYVDKTFAEVMPENVFQIHGHRNVKSLPITNDNRTFNLEGKVEFGGTLRCVQISHDSITRCETKNNIYKMPEDFIQHNEALGSSMSDTIMHLRNNRYINEKKYGNISSFNFSNQAFYDKVWDEQTMKARGLYIDTQKCKVVARAYDKFFNINERPETKFDMLQYRLQFPVTAYVKENGFLGIVSYDEYNNDLFITTKSNPEGNFAQWFKEMIYNKMSSENIDKMRKYIKDHNVSFVFECVDMEHDPHIIEYKSSNFYLLDIVSNDIEFNKYEFENMCNIADQFGLLHKEKAYEIASWQDFFDWYNEVLDEDYEFNNRKIEGFVIEDSTGFMTKLKLSYYNFWKFMRSISHEAIRKGNINPKRTSALTTPLANEYYSWVKTLHEKEKADGNVPKDICTLRNMFYQFKLDQAN